jgi:hypothetical protein
MLQIVLPSWKKGFIDEYRSLSYDDGGDINEGKKPAHSPVARQGRLQLRSVLCKPLSLVGRLDSRLGTGRRVLIR